MSAEKKSDAGTAVWYFVGATFAAALGPTLLSPSPGHWATIIWIGLAVVLGILGGVVLVRELRQRKGRAD